MKVITLFEPWAFLTVIGIKRIETRNWGTSYRGELGIHASSSFPGVYKRLCLQHPFNRLLRAAGIEDINDLPVGKILGTVDLTDCREMVMGTLPQVISGILVDEQERALGLYEPGRVMWLLAKAEQWEVPVTARGYQRIWEWDESLRQIISKRRGVERGAVTQASGPEAENRIQHLPAGPGPGLGAHQEKSGPPPKAGEEGGG